MCTSPLMISNKSHPSWVRGLKQRLLVDSAGVQRVAPLVGAWIETYQPVKMDIDGLSHPSWVRGLKRLSLSDYFRLLKSHPSWVRGLKQRFLTMSK